MKLKKILLIGFFGDGSNYFYANSFKKVLNEFGFNVECVDYRDRFIKNNIINNFIINKKVLFKASKFKPDLVFFIKSESIYSKTIYKLKQMGSKVINFYPDNPFVFWNGNSNSNVLNSLPYYDCFLSWSKALIPIIKTAGAKDVYYFPFAYDKDVYDKQIKLTERELKKYRSDVCFAGTWDKEREIWLEGLSKQMPHINLSIWGNLWDEKLPCDSVLRYKLKGNAIYRDDLIKLFKSSKIVLNFIRKQNETSHNMRTLEVPSTKSFLLTERTEEQANFLFEEGKSIECFDSVDELSKKIKFYLSNEEERRKIISQSFKRVQQFELKIVLKDFMEYIQGE